MWGVIFSSLINDADVEAEVRRPQVNLPLGEDAEAVPVSRKASTPQPERGDAQPPPPQTAPASQGIVNRLGALGG